jgi:hypothetical protein
LKTKKHSNIGVFFMLGAMFLVLGMIANRGFLAIGITFIIIGLASIGRQRISFLDELEERIDDADHEGPIDEEK